jgi:hypothetical protein
MPDDKLLDANQLWSVKALVRLGLDRFEPEFGSGIVALDMDMPGFMGVARVEMKPIGADDLYRGHTEPTPY